MLNIVYYISYVHISFSYISCVILSYTVGYTSNITIVCSTLSVSITYIVHRVYNLETVK